MSTDKTKFHFYTSLCSREVHRTLFSQYNLTACNAVQKFFRSIAEGLNHETSTDVVVNCILPINNEHRRFFWHFKSSEEDGTFYNYVPLINLPIIKNLLSGIYIFFQILFKKNLQDQRDFVIVDFLRLSINLPVVIACKIRGIKTIGVVTDLPGEDVFKKTLKVRLRNLFIFRLTFDFYICVTRDLNSVVNKKKRPFLMIEGFSDIKVGLVENILGEKFQERVLIYAGSLYKQYGLETLIEGFHLLKDQDVRLWFYGVGPFSSEIERYSEKDPRVKYMGVLPNEELMVCLTKATLLINPRPSHEAYTKYSYPSKNMEAMSVGTPLVTTKLHGIPNDHFPFIFIIEEETAHGIYKTLKFVLQKTRHDLHKFGDMAKRFTLSEKNNISQCYKILNLTKD